MKDTLKDGMVWLEASSVIYRGDDRLALLCAVASLAPQAIIMAYLTLILSRREAETILLFGGQFGCELVNNTLKDLIRDYRPNLYGYGYGMPSAHTQFMVFYATYRVLWMNLRVPHFWSLSERLGQAVLVICGACFVAYSRVYLEYHTMSQIIIGGILGVVCGIAWFAIVCLVRDLGIIDLLLDTQPARWLYIKDTAAEQASFIKDEYVDWRRKRVKMKLLVKA